MFFPGQDPIGKRIKAAGFSTPRNPDGVWRTIVGVVGNVRYRGLHEIQLDLYDPPTQSNLATTSLVVRLKNGEERDGAGGGGRDPDQAKQRDSRVLVSGITMLDDDRQQGDGAVAIQRVGVRALRGVAFSLSMLGLFSLVSLDVANRRREFAIRMAVGATDGDIVRGVFRSAGVRAAMGIAVGLAGAVRDPGSRAPAVRRDARGRPDLRHGDRSSWWWSRSPPTCRRGARPRPTR